MDALKNDDLNSTKGYRVVNCFRYSPKQLMKN